MPIWQKPISLELMARAAQGTAIAHLGIEFLDFGDDFIRGRVPVDARTVQPFGLLHGGISVVLAETLGSYGAVYSSPPGWLAVGLEINANHLRAARQGWVTGTARALHLGRSTQVWQIDMADDQGRPTCISRLTMALMAPRDGQPHAPG